MNSEKAMSVKSAELMEGTRLHLKPNADVAELFQDFNEQFFWGKLKYVEVRWSPRMTSCAGICAYSRRPGYCSIRLSRPLLSLRTKVDLVETLLHEMIHAYLFVTENNKDRDGHGPEFLKHMFRINREVGLNISVFHTFHDEVKHYQQHVWLCNGPCQSRSPYHGKVCRSMNRAPGPTDYWWFEHESQCGGTFSKIAEPPGYIPTLTRKRSASQLTPTKKAVAKSKDIRSFFKPARQDEKNFIQKRKIGIKKTTVSSVMSGEKVKTNVEDSARIKNDVNDDNGKKGSIGITNSITNSAGNESSSILIEETSTAKQIESDENLEDSASDCSSSESDTDYSDCDSSDSPDSGFISIFGYLGMPVSFSKRRIKDPDPATIKVRKPNLNAVPKSKRGSLKNVIKMADQPSLDSFYQKKKLPSMSVKVERETPILKISQQKEKMKQKTMQSFFIAKKE